jgi:predicted Zn-dependent protease
MKKLILSAILVACVTPSLWAQDDVESRAMRDEMKRSMKDLQLTGQEKPYYIAYKIVDSNRMEAQASFGALTSSAETRTRVLSVTVRVGSYDFDNSSAPSSGAGIMDLLGSLMSSSVILPVDDNYDELRRKIWLATDSAYKRAVEDLSAKKAALASRNRDTESVPSFSKETARQETETLPAVQVKLASLEQTARVTSAAFRTMRMAESGSTEVEVVNSTERFINSEGTTYVRQVPDVYFHAQASLQNATGEVFSDSASEYGRSMSELPDQAALVKESQAVADRLTERRKGHSAKRYNGPVLLEGQASAELFARDFAELLSSHPHSGGASSGLMALLSGPTASLMNKMGSRVLPDFLTVVDNPQLAEADGHKLFGSYKFDEEGTPAQETVLVKDGILKTLLTSRTPARGMLVSTGNMRERGVMPGNLLVSSTKSSNEEELKAQLIDLVKTRGLEYGIILRRMSRNAALEAVRVYPDGHEEALRDARVAEVTASSFKDVLAVSKERTVFTDRGAGSVLSAGLFSSADLITYVVPDMLFEDMTMEHVGNESPKLPIVASPLAAE